MNAEGKVIDQLCANINTHKIMTTQPIATLPRLLSLMIGAGLIFIGGRFLVTPETAELGFGLHYSQPNNAFHTIKGIRDVFAGLLITLLAWQHQRYALWLTLLTGSIIPVADLLVVWRTPGSLPSTIFIHGGTTLALWLLCYALAKPMPSVRQSV